METDVHTYVDSTALRPPACASSDDQKRNPKITYHDELLPDSGEGLPALGILPALHLGDLRGTSPHHHYPPAAACSRRKKRGQNNKKTMAGGGCAGGLGGGFGLRFI